MSRLDRERDLWLSHGIEDYEMTVRRVCNCISVVPVIVTVVDGQVTSRRFSETNTPVPGPDAPLYPGVLGVFDLAEDAYRRASTVNITFHATYGFPESLTIDWVRNAVDDEISYTITNFTR